MIRERMELRMVTLNCITTVINFITMLLGRGKSYRKNLAEAAKTDSVAIDVGD